MKRDIITIDEDACTGCGACIPNCPEGALQLIDGKARLVSDLYCDGLGACIGNCPEDAITIENREAEPYDESRVMENIVKQGDNTIKAHLAHLIAHGEKELLREAEAFLRDRGFDPEKYKKSHDKQEETPAKEREDHGTEGRQEGKAAGKTSFQPSSLGHWPVQFHLLNPRASVYEKSDLLLAADCTAFTAGNFHSDYLQGKTLAVACPKLDSNQQVYLEKLITLIDEGKINTLSVLIMEVPCCRGLLKLAETAREHASRNIPIKRMVMSVKGELLQEEWM